MRAVVTRVTEASVTIDGAEYSRISRGFLVLLGVHVLITAQATIFSPLSITNKSFLSSADCAVCKVG